MTRRPVRVCLSIGVVVAGLASIVVSGQSNAVNLADGTSKGEWPYYSGDVRGTRFSPLEQINASNFNKLEVAWRFKTDNLGTRPEYKLEGTPLMVGGTLYATAGTRRAVVALDAATARTERWRASDVIPSGGLYGDLLPARRSAAVTDVIFPGALPGAIFAGISIDGASGAVRWNSFTRPPRRPWRPTTRAARSPAPARPGRGPSSRRAT